MIRAVVLFLCVPSFVSADAWDVFVNRCLEPFEEAVNPTVTDLTLFQSTDVSDTYRLETASYLIETTLGNRPGIWSPQACLVAAQTDVSRQELLAGFRNWEKTAIASGRYVPSETEPSTALTPMPPGLLSAGFREPLIIVSLMEDWHDKPTFVAVQETSLES